MVGKAQIITALFGGMVATASVAYAQPNETQIDTNYVAPEHTLKMHQIKDGYDINLPNNNLKYDKNILINQNNFIENLNQNDEETDVDKLAKRFYGVVGSYILREKQNNEMGIDTDPFELAFNIKMDLIRYVVGPSSSKNSGLCYGELEHLYKQENMKGKRLKEQDFKNFYYCINNKTKDDLKVLLELDELKFLKNVINVNKSTVGKAVGGLDKSIDLKLGYNKHGVGFEQHNPKINGINSTLSLMHNGHNVLSIVKLNYKKCTYTFVLDMHSIKKAVFKKGNYEFNYNPRTDLVEMQLKKDIGIAQMIFESDIDTINLQNNESKIFLFKEFKTKKKVKKKIKDKTKKS
ncbi:hypothetical protein ACFL1H_03525 [Nanoarchaeota archaeon]